MCGYRLNVVLCLQCSKTCGEGVKRRIVQCIDTRGAHMSSYQCNRSQRPPNIQLCSSEPCPREDQWNTLPAASQIQYREASSSGNTDKSQGVWHTDPWTPVHRTTRRVHITASGNGSPKSESRIQKLSRARKYWAKRRLDKAKTFRRHLQIMFVDADYESLQESNVVF